MDALLERIDRLSGQLHAVDAALAQLQAQVEAQAARIAELERVAGVQPMQEQRT